MHTHPLERRGPLRLDCGGGFTMQPEEVIPAGTSCIKMPLLPNVANFARRAPRNTLGVVIRYTRSRGSPGAAKLDFRYIRTEILEIKMRGFIRLGCDW